MFVWSRRRARRGRRTGGVWTEHGGRVHRGGTAGKNRGTMLFGSPTCCRFSAYAWQSHSVFIILYQFLSSASGFLSPGESTYPEYSKIKLYTLDSVDTACWPSCSPSVFPPETAFAGRRLDGHGRGQQRSQVNDPFSLEGACWRCAGRARTTQIDWRE